MRRLVAVALLLAATRAIADEPATGGAAVGEGAPLYLLGQVAPAIDGLRRLGVNESAPLVEIKQRWGVDPLDARLVGAAGVDVARPFAASLFEPVAGGRWLHHRIVLPLDGPRTFLLLVAGMKGAAELPFVMPQAGTPLARAEVRAVVTLPDGTIAILRMIESAAIVDAATPADGDVPEPLELARRYPIAPVKPFGPSVSRGAREILDGAALAIYVDGRRLPALAAPLVFAASEGTIATRREAARKAGPRCQAEWSRAPGTFDDLALALAPREGGMDLRAGWGSAAGRVPLGFATVDDGALGVDMLAPLAAATVSLRSVSLAPFHSLRRTGPLHDLPSLVAAFQRCPSVAGLALAVRHWPQAIGAALEALPASERAGAFGQILDALVGKLRNVDLFVFGGAPQGAGQARWAIAATVGNEARALLQAFLGGGADPEILSFGKRHPMLYTLDGIDLGVGAVTVEPLANGRTLLAFADSADTARKCYASSGQPPVASPPLVSARVDGPKLRRVATTDDARVLSFLDALAHLGRFRADLSTEKGGFRLTIATPLVAGNKQQ